MQITVIKKNKLNVFTLPEKISGSYWITDFENGKKINLINIEATENGWNIISNNEAFIVDNNDVMVPYTILKDYNFYLLKNNYKNEKYYIYCSPIHDNTYKELGAQNKITVGYDKSCDICYRLNGLPKKAFNIEKKDNYYFLNVLEQNTNVYVNKEKVINTKRIEYGDMIFIFGLRIILMRKNGMDYYLVNNPNNLLEFSASYVNVVPVQNDFIEDNKELTIDANFTTVDYFYRAPHFYKALETMIVNVDVPPQRKEDDKTPAALTIGPMITMSMTSVVMLINTLNEMNSGTSNPRATTSSLIMCLAMLASSLLWPILTKIYQKISNKLYEFKRQKLYKKYINKKEKEIKEQLEVQRKSLIENNFNVIQCQKVILERTNDLWQRRITDSDFLTLPVGFGNMPMKIQINYPEEHFTLEQDNLLDIAHTLGKTDRILNNVPITYSFYENKATGVVGDSIVTKELIDRLMLQIMANYSYDEVKIVTFTSTDNEKDWDYIKTLPHSWSNDNTLRFFGSSNDDYREIIYNLEKIYHERKEKYQENERCMPHYIIITDAIKSIESFDFIKEIMANNNNLGFSIIMLVDKVTALPNECKSFISVTRQECAIYNSVINKADQKFLIDYSPIYEIYNCARELSNIPINIKSEVESTLPDTYKFLEMYQVGKVEQLNSLERWKKSNPILSLQAPIGIGKSGEIINLDLHEKYHGPHGLIAGTTGSGKSEFIITYILSLAVNYHPYEVQIILIDYKGGSLAGAFTGDNYRLPHLAGTITNLDGSELNRSLASIESEIKRRQREFNDAKAMTNESSVDIYKYQKLWREGRLKDKEPIAHLFIISDEFAELKEQQPEFMDKLISAARVGRSLGIHLILATQKPGGVVDPQIWSNTRFRVCLKVQDTSDSQEVLKKPDAAYLKKTGRFYLQVGTDEVFTLGQSAWAGGQYFPSPVLKKEVDTSVSAINNIGFVTTTKEIENNENVVAVGEELPNVVKYLNDIAVNNNIKIHKLWLDKIPEKIYIDSLINKYNFAHEPYYLNPIIGEYDDPTTQSQNVLNIPFSKLGNAIIYGISGSGKENFLTSLIYSSMVSYTPEEVNFYIMDFGGETLKVFENSPYVGDILYTNDKDKLENLLKLLETELEMRKDKFANYGGNYQNYITKSSEKLPNIVVIINFYEVLTENYEDIIENINTLSREAFKYGIYFVVTATSENSVRIKTRQNFSLTYVLQQNNESDYSSILGNIHGNLPAKYKGRGLFKRDNIYEFQTAYVNDDEYNYLVEFCDKKSKETEYRAKKIPVLPNVVDYNAIKNDITNSSNIVVGINKVKLISEKYNFSKNAINLICSEEIDNTIPFVNSLVNEVLYIKYYSNIYFMNSTDININNNLKNRIYNQKFDEFIIQINNYITEVYKVYESSNYNDEIINKQKKFMVVIFGVYDFINKLSEDTKKLLSEMMRKDNQIGLVSFVFVDNPDVIKAFSYEEWFKYGCDTSRGIYIGSGFSNQNIFKISRINSEDREEITNDYGYVINSSKQSKVKLLQDFNEQN